MKKITRFIRAIGYRLSLLVGLHAASPNEVAATGGPKPDPGAQNDKRNRKSHTNPPSLLKSQSVNRGHSNKSSSWFQRASSISIGNFGSILSRSPQSTQSQAPPTSLSDVPENQKNPQITVVYCESIDNFRGALNSLSAIIQQRAHSSEDQTVHQKAKITSSSIFNSFEKVKEMLKKNNISLLHAVDQDGNTCFALIAQKMPELSSDKLSDKECDDLSTCYSIFIADLAVIASSEKRAIIINKKVNIHPSCYLLDQLYHHRSHLIDKFEINSTRKEQISSLYIQVLDKLLRTEAGSTYPTLSELGIESGVRENDRDIIITIINGAGGSIAYSNVESGAELNNMANNLDASVEPSAEPADINVVAQDIQASQEHNNESIATLVQGTARDQQQIDSEERESSNLSTSSGEQESTNRSSIGRLLAFGSLCAGAAIYIYKYFTNTSSNDSSDKSK